MRGRRVIDRQHSMPEAVLKLPQSAANSFVFIHVCATRTSGKFESFWDTLESSWHRWHAETVC
jgi:hypothetical protein